MDNNFLSQDEINMLLNNIDEEESTNTISSEDQDILGEVGNISMGSAATSLSELTRRKVSITTPQVSITTLNKIKSGITGQAVIVEVEYVEGISGHNLLMLNIEDAAVICNLMMGMEIEKGKAELTELEISAVHEAMNQMIGSSATSMSVMFDMCVNISTPKSYLYSNENPVISDSIKDDEELVKIEFELEIEDAVQSNIMMFISTETAKVIIDKMTGSSASVVNEEVEVKNVEASNVSPKEEVNETPVREEIVNPTPITYENQQIQTPVTVKKATFSELTETKGKSHDNIDLIMDVPLQISVVLGRTKQTIKEVLEFSNGSLIELDKLAEEPVEILVNGKTIALGEVVVIDENFGVRITDIVSGAERIKTLK